MPSGLGTYTLAGRMETYSTAGIVGSDVALAEEPYMSIRRAPLFFLAGVVAIAFAVAGLHAIIFGESAPDLWRLLTGGLTGAGVLVWSKATQAWVGGRRSGP